MLPSRFPSSLLFAAALAFAGCGGTPRPEDLCSESYAKKCSDVEDATEAQCVQQLDSLLTLADKVGASCRSAVDTYFECYGKQLDAVDQCTDQGRDLGKECNDDALECVSTDDTSSDDSK